MRNLLFLILLLLPAASSHSQPAAPTSVEEAVAAALAESPSLRAAEAARRGAMIEADGARPRLRPEFGLEATGVLAGGGGELASRLLDNGGAAGVALLVKMPLFRAGLGDAPARRARALADIAAAGYQQEQLDLVLQVREAYFNLLRAERGAAIAQAAAATAAAAETTAAAAVERGVRAEVDLMDARRGTAEARAAAVKASSGAALARLALLRLMGRPLDAPLTTADPSDPADPGPLSQLLAGALDRRPEVRLLRAQTELARAGEILAKSEGRPRVDLEGRIGAGRGNVLVPGSPGAGFDLQPERYGAAIVRLTVPLKSRAGQMEADQAAARVEQLTALLTDLEAGIALEIESARAGMTAAAAERASAQAAVTAARAALEVTRLRFELGRATPLELENAVLSLRRAQLLESEASIDRLMNWARLERALGRGHPAPAASQ